MRSTNAAPMSSRAPAFQPLRPRGRERTLEITFLESGVEAYVFTFG
jgi:hypothetical protein